uniref:Uncharacterized protein n=1 Tax=Tetraselmis chuii TaxID=63592 RepID=A0A7S1X3C2_9CHLO|mmetsp:Transcript_24418/g.43481  ORF Transcript_24418/g.43481 Transcript_24418/m.43481 type:complete len:132 (+) Transcript_24418:224-619(+)
MSRQVIRAGVLYFVVVFGTGFLLGPLRILWVEPRVGSRAAELLEMPIMFAVVVAAARGIVRRYNFPCGPARGSRLLTGCTALALLLAAELTLVLWLRGLTVQEYLENRDPVTGAAYYGMLGVMAVMPALVQ